MKECVAAVGTFDGVHVGHRKILGRVNAIGRERGLTSRVITFPNHPLSVVAPERVPGWILPREESVARMEDLVDCVSEITFTKELASLSAADFLKLISRRYNVKVLVMGHDNTFGSDRLATRADYESAAKEAGIEIEWVEAATLDDGTPVSSSLVRKTLAQGKMSEVNELLDGIYILEGVVKEGRKEGRKLNFPTLNIEHDGYAPVGPGVYVGVYTGKDDYDHIALVNVGNNPTFGPGNPVTYEVHVVNHDLGDCYGDVAGVAMWVKVRDEKKFARIDELKAAISEDVHDGCLRVGNALEVMSEVYNFHPDTLQCIENHQKAELKRYKKSAEAKDL